MTDVSGMMDKLKPKYIIAIVLCGSLINILPSIYTEYNNKSSTKPIGADDTIRDVAKTFTYYNRSIIDGFKNLLDSNMTLSNREYSTFVYDLLERGWSQGFAELNRHPFCMKNVGEWVEQNINSDDTLKEESLSVVSNGQITTSEKIIMLELLILSYSQKTGKSLKTHLKSVEKCKKS